MDLRLRIITVQYLWIVNLFCWETPVTERATMVSTYPSEPLGQLRKNDKVLCGSSYQRCPIVHEKKWIDTLRIYSIYGEMSFTQTPYPKICLQEFCSYFKGFGLWKTCLDSIDSRVDQ